MKENGRQKSQLFSLKLGFFLQCSVILALYSKLFLEIKLFTFGNHETNLR